MEQSKVSRLVDDLELEARNVLEAWDRAWNGALHTDDDDDRRQYVHDTALILNALGNIRLAQAIHRQQNEDQ